LDFFGLINMNGRMYDPLLGRMLSPDPFVQAPTFTQSFNRYSYVWNNPLKYTDPSGYFVDGYDAWYGWGPGYAGSYGEYAERGGDGWDRYVLDRIIGCPFTRANMQATARGRAGVGGLGIGSWGGRASSGNFAGSSGAWFASQFFWSAAGLQGWNNNGWGGYLIEKSYASFSGDGLRRFFGGIGSWMRSLFPQVVLNDAVSREGINNKNWLHANERNIRRVNERYGTNLWLENGEINWTRGIYIFYTTWINCRKQ
jgi:RHS repeat-associated protein